MSPVSQVRDISNLNLQMPETNVPKLISRGRCLHRPEKNEIPQRMASFTTLRIKRRYGMIFYLQGGGVGAPPCGRPHKAVFKNRQPHMVAHTKPKKQGYEN